MGKPENRIITGSGSTCSGLVPTAENRRITGSGSSGSVLVPALANRISTTIEKCWKTTQNTLSSDPQGTIEQFWQTTQNPLSSDPRGILRKQVRRLIEEDPIQDVRNKDIVDAISKKIRLLEEIPSAFCEQIWRNKEAIAKDRGMQELFRGFSHTIRGTSSFFSGLARCLSMENTQHYILSRVFRNVARGSPPLDKVQREKVKEMLRDFVKNADRNPFKGLQQHLNSLLEQYEQLRKKLEEKVKKLSGKRKASRVWSIFSGSLMAALTAAAAITSVVVVVVATPAAGVITPALGLYATSIGYLDEMMFSFHKKAKNLREAGKMAEKVIRHVDQTEFDLKGIEGSMKDLKDLKAPIVSCVKSYLESRGLLNLGDIANQIVKLEGRLLPKLDDLVKKLDGCLTKLNGRIEDLKKLFL